MSTPPTYRWIDKPMAAIFLERLNRFACMVEIGSEPTKVYLPNSGRLEELLRTGARVIVERRRDKGKTLHDLLMIETKAYPSGEPTWAALDSRLPPLLFRFALEHGFMDDLAEATVDSMEPTLDEGRLDLKLQREGQPYFVETKSVNLIDQHGVARFPDAPTIRGQRHLRELIRLKGEGAGAGLAFIISRSDPQAMAPFEERDPAFSRALGEAAEAGVRLRALSFDMGPVIKFHASVPVDLDPGPFPGYWPNLAEA